MEGRGVDQHADRVAGGHSGGWAAQVANTVAGANCGLDDKPSWVSLTQAGAYTASIWARSDTPGLTLKLRVREYVGGVLQGSVVQSMGLTSSWQQVSAVYTPVAPGSSSLDFEAFTSSAPSACASRRTTRRSPTEREPLPPHEGWARRHVPGVVRGVIVADQACDAGSSLTRPTVSP